MIETKTPANLSTFPAIFSREVRFAFSSALFSGSVVFSATIYCPWNLIILSPSLMTQLSNFCWQFQSQEFLVPPHKSLMRFINTPSRVISSFASSHSDTTNSIKQTLNEIVLSTTLSRWKSAIKISIGWKRMAAWKLQCLLCCSTVARSLNLQFR